MRPAQSSRARGGRLPCQKRIPGGARARSGPASVAISVGPIHAVLHGHATGSTGACMRFALLATHTILRPLPRPLLRRNPLQAITHAPAPPFFAHTHVRHYKRRKSYPVMAAVEDISTRLEALNVRGGVKEHASVKGPEEWRREAGEGVFTKTVSGRLDERAGGRRRGAVGARGVDCRTRARMSSVARIPFVADGTYSRSA